MQRISAFIVSVILASTVWASETIPISFFTHIQMKMPEQDVFVQSASDSSMVVRVESDEAEKPETLTSRVFSTATATEHDPFKISSSPLGPFTKGKSLGFTLEEWLAATGSGTYTVDGDKAQLSVIFEKLIPSSVYTIWCSRVTFPPKAAVVDKPCGKADGSENMFTTDAAGNGTIFVRMNPLEESTKETASVVALVYHSDGKTSGALPGAFGLNTHVQLLSILPAKETITEQIKETAEQVRQETRWWLVFGGLMLVGLGAWWVKKRTLSELPDETKDV